MKTSLTKRLRYAAAGAALAAATWSVPVFAADASDAPLADRVPSGAILYAGWAGTDAAGEAMDGTHAEAVLSASNLPELFEEYLPRAAAALARQSGDRDAEAMTRTITDLAQMAWRHPTVIAFGGVDWNSPVVDGDPLPRIMIVCNAADEAPQLRASVNELFRRMGQPELAFVVSEQQGHVYLAIGYSEMDMAQLTQEGARGALATGDFAQVATPTFESLDGAPLFVGYLNMPALVEVVQQGMERDEGAEAVAEFREGFNALGLNGVGRLVVASGFVGESFETAAMLELSPDRQGLTRLLPPSGAGLDAATLAAIPGDASLAAAGRLELDQLVDVARSLVTRFDPDNAQQFEQAVGFVGQLVGTDLERNLLDQFGPTWAAFTSPRIGGDLSSGVVVNAPKDRDLLRRGMASMSINLSSVGTEALAEETDGNGRIPGRSVEVDGTWLHVLNAPLIAPTWTVDEERLYLGFYPQHVAAARMIGGGFEESDAWASIREMADGNEPVGFTYANLPETARSSYGQVLALMQLATGAADTFGGNIRLEPPTIVLPPLPTLMEHLTPSMSVSWVDDDGIHFRGREPFPLSNLLSGTGGGAVAAVPAMMGVFVPALGEAREAARKVQSASNMRQFGMGLHMYADEHDLRFPATLDALLDEDYGLTRELFDNPRSDDGVALELAADPELEEAPSNISRTGSYLYAGGDLHLLDLRDAGQVAIAWEDPDFFYDGINVLYADGHVEFVEFPRAYDLIDRSVASLDEARKD